MRAPGVATIDVTVNGVTGTAPIVVQDPFTLQAPNIVKSDSTFTATTTFDQHRRPGRPRSPDKPGRAERLDGDGDLARIVLQRRSRSAGDGHLERHDPRHREPG